MRPLLLNIAIVGLIATAANAQETSALINKRLDEPVQVHIDKALPDALEAITATTGVRFKEDPLIWDLLPWGRETKITAKMENVTLRQALNIITQKVGLVMVLRDDHVEIQPMPALRRLGQRASRDELLALDLLASRPLNLDTDRPTIRRLLEAVDLKLMAEKEVQIAVENRIGDAVGPERTIFVPRNATLMQALESLTIETRITWYPWERSVVVCPKEDRTRRLLAKPLRIRPGQRGMDVGEFLLEISRGTGVPFEFQPGVIQNVPADSRIIRGDLTNVPALQAMEFVVGATGLAYSIHDDKVLIASPNAIGQRDRAIGLLQLPSGFQVLVPASQVPPDIQEYIRHKTQKELDKIRLMMEEEGFKPTTQPAGKVVDDHEL